MPSISFHGDSVTQRVGADLLSLLLEAGCDIQYVCMAGSCGTCRVWVTAGGENLQPPEAWENRGAPAGTRLACQARCTGNGDIAIDQ